MCPAAQMVESSGSSCKQALPPPWLGSYQTAGALSPPPEHLPPPSAASQVGPRKRPHRQSPPAGEKMVKEDGAPSEGSRQGGAGSGASSGGASAGLWKRYVPQRVCLPGRLAIPRRGASTERSSPALPLWRLCGLLDTPLPPGNSVGCNKGVTQVHFFLKCIVRVKGNLSF